MSLNHQIVRPISVHSYAPVAKLIQHLTTIVTIIFLWILASLVYLAYKNLLGAPASITAIIIVPIIAGIILFVFFIHYKSTFYRELSYLKRKFKLKIVHTFRHK